MPVAIYCIENHLCLFALSRFNLCSRNFQEQPRHIRLLALQSIGRLGQIPISAPNVTRPFPIVFQTSVVKGIALFRGAVECSQQCGEGQRVQLCRVTVYCLNLSCHFLSLSISSLT